MKRIYFGVAVFFTLVAQAQVINFPDAKFKAKLLQASTSAFIAFDADNNAIAIDTNSNGEIETTEALAVYYLTVQGNQFDQANMISDLTGIAAFTNLRYLSCQMNLLTSLDLTALANLETVICSNNSINPLNVSGLSNLKSITAGNNQIASLAAINTSGAGNIEYLRLDQNLFTSVDLTGFPNLKTINFDFNDLTAINVTGLDLLEKIDISNNALTAINLTTLPNFKYLNATGNFLTALDVSQNPLLTNLYLRYNQITSLDLTHNTAFSYLNIQDNNLNSLFIKNGRNDTVELTSNPNLAYICADESELTNVMLYFNALTEVNSYCSFVPGGTFYTVAGSNSYDQDNDGCEVTDIAIPHLKVAVTNGTTSGTTIANQSGDYSIPLPAGDYTFTPSFENSEFFTISPETLALSFPSDNSPYNQPFCVTANGTHPDLEIVIVPMLLARPGFDCSYRILYKNKGNQIQSGNVAFAFNDAVLDFVSCSPLYTTQIMNYLNWSFTDLHPFETRYIDVRLNLNSPVEIPAVNDGFLLNCTASISAGTTEETPADNNFALTQYAFNSFDPNDKTCLEGNNVSTQMIGNYVHYMIRFENTGSASAVNIVVKDIIDMAKFDVTSLVPMTGSHDFRTRVSGNKVEFIFENINLPFDDANNDGFLVFKIKTLPNLVEGDSFSNAASIYFDYNAPVDTAPAITGIGTLAKQDFIFGDYFRVYPNPTADFLNIEAKDTAVISSVKIYNALGQLVLTSKGSGRILKLEVSRLEAGNYVIEIQSGDRASKSKFIKK
jgi:uncharacterized repeat protein (TIGR01451 family)